MTRIRYLKDSNGNLTSKLPVLCNTVFYTVDIDVEKLLYLIVDNDRNVVKTGSAPTLSTLKMKAKKALKELGAKFDDEIRQVGKIEKL